MKRKNFNKQEFKRGLKIGLIGGLAMLTIIELSKLQEKYFPIENPTPSTTNSEVFSQQETPVNDLEDALSKGLSVGQPVYFRNEDGVERELEYAGKDTRGQAVFYSPSNNQEVFYKDLKSEGFEFYSLPNARRAE